MARALIVAAPQSGSGKTLITLGLIRALRNSGLKVASAKIGPDYIDPQFHTAASGRPCLNLDYWAMGPALCRQLLDELSHDADIVIIEGVMGLFDGPDGAKGSTADLALALGLPIMLVIDAGHQAQSIAALAQGFANYMPDLKLQGVFLNRIRSDRHGRILQSSLLQVGIQILGQLRHNDSLHMPSRHLGLVQAMENQALETFLESAAAGVARETKLDNVVNSSTEIANQANSTLPLVPPLGQTIAIAKDEAFAFAYPHLLSGWQKAGAEILFFSPLLDESPSTKADALFLPGGYPELYAGKLAANTRTLSGIRKFQGLIYGECGGYMLLGENLVDAKGISHTMTGLLPLETSFAKPQLHLGYRELRTLCGPLPERLRGHEFHYASISREGEAERLFDATTAAGMALPAMGLRRGPVMGSFAHIIGVAP